MAAIDIGTKTVATVERGDMLGLPAVEAVTAGQYIRSDSSGYFGLGHALSSSEVGVGYIATDNADLGAVVEGMREGILNLGTSLASLAMNAAIWLGTVDGQLVDADPSANEVSQVEMFGTAGSWKPIYNGGTAGAVDFDATAAEVQAVMEALSTVGPNNMFVSIPASGTYQFEFANDLGNQNVGALTVDESSGTLLGGTTAVTVATSGTHGVKIGTVVPVFGNGATADKLLKVDIKEVGFNG